MEIMEKSKNNQQEVDIKPCLQENSMPRLMVTTKKSGEKELWVAAHKESACNASAQLMVYVKFQQQFSVK